MTMSNKATIMDQINAINFETLTENQFDFLVERAKKSVRKGSAKKTLSKTQKENAGIKLTIFDTLEENGEGMTATAIGNAVGISCQRASALLNQMVESNDLIKVKNGKATLFMIPEGEEEEEIE